MVSIKRILVAMPVLVFATIVLLAATALGLGETCISDNGQKNKAHIESLYSLFGRNEFSKLVQHLDPNVKWVIGQELPYSTGNAPWFQTFNTKDNVLRFFESHANDFNVFKFVPFDWAFSEDGNIVNTRVDIGYENKATKKKGEYTLLHQFKFRDSRIYEFRSNFDTLGVDQLYHAVTANDLRSVGRAVIEGINRRDLDSVGKIFTDDVKIWALAHNKRPMGRAEWKQTLIDLLKGFPDAQFTIDDILADPSTQNVVVRHHVVGTHKGTFQGMSATNKRVKMTSIAIFHVTANTPTSFSVPEWWMEVDMMGLMAQLGVLPLPTQLA